MWRALLPLCLMLAAPAFAQSDDDLLAPLTAGKKKPATAKPKPKPKPKTATKPAPATTPDELAPLTAPAPVTPAKGELGLKLAAVNKRATLRIDDSEEQLQPWSAKMLSAGEHTVVVKSLGFATWTRKLVVSPNRLTEVYVTLEPVASIVMVNSDVAGAEVWINGKSVGPAPVELEVPPGSVDVAVKKEGYRDAAQSLKTIAGREYPLSVRMQPAAVSSTIVATSDRPVEAALTPNTATSEALTTEATYDASPPIYTRWYFWVGAAAVVAAASVGTYAAVKANSYSPGDEACKGAARRCLDQCVNFDCSGNLKSALSGAGAGAGVLHF